MNFWAKLLTLVIKGIIKLICKFEGDSLSSVPQKGPLLLVINHINFLDAPLIYTLLHPRRVRGITKKENWDNWFVRILGNAWEAISIDRENPSKSTFKEIRKSFRDNRILCIAPEGTRSGTGILREGHPGVAYIALQSQVPLVLIAHYGTEKFWDNIKRFRRTKITIAVSQPFLLVNESKVNREIQREMTEQIMARLATMLPENYRGVYKNLDVISAQYVQQYQVPAEIPE
ncbi:MAG: 1-acyl-sn-glycerol-3-phosphate acyltransferase [Candidatus Atribacteria bacterium]|nr:1-acyl-sn-glycerol-3-phosphate acyltransferase [Candidatus Atribacteria bacterium]